MTVGNGSCEILLSAADALLEPGAEMVYAWPSFSMYAHLEKQSGATGIRVPLDDGGYHDLDAMRKEITAATRLISSATRTTRPPPRSRSRRSTSSWRRCRATSR